MINIPTRLITTARRRQGIDSQYTYLRNFATPESTTIAPGTATGDVPDSDTLT